MMPDPLQLSGSTLEGKYDVVAVAAHQGPFVTYRGLHRLWQEPVAIHVLLESANNLARRDEAVRSVLRAGALVARLSSRSPAVPATRDGGTLQTAYGPLAYAVAEWIEQPTLRQVLDGVQPQGRGRVNLGPVLEWFDDVMQALTLAHGEGIVLGSLAAETLTVSGGSFRPPGALKLDGLLAAAVRVNSPEALFTAPEVASLRIAPPELATRDASRVGPWTDVFSLGMIFAELLAGRAVDLADPVDSKIAPAVRWAIERAITPSLEERFRSVEMFREALGEALPQGSARTVRPRRTMVVATQDDEERGSAGSFEVASVDPAEVQAPNADEPDVPKARVRFAHTQRIASPFVNGAAMTDHASGPQPVYTGPPTVVAAGQAPMGGYRPPAPVPNHQPWILLAVVALIVACALGTLTLVLAFT